MTAPPGLCAKQSSQGPGHRRCDNTCSAPAENCPDRAHERGTALVEALVAVLIVCSVAGALFETIASKASISRQVELRRAAVLVARSQLAAAMAGAQGPRDGDVGTLHWSVAVEPFDSNARSSRLALDEVQVTVSDRAARNRTLLELRSLRPAQ